MTTEILICRAIERGLSLRDFDNMTVGMIIDLIITYNNLNNKDDEEEVREANQNDFDNF